MKTEPRMVGNEAQDTRRYDTRSGRDVMVKGRPDTYRRGHVWVQPVEGGEGWLAACDDLVLPEEGRS
ncbi:hypothetical protein [Streptomyces sp. NPDC048644]|uniref:hypothetical protein n=1 Tax=Streptomyces sp. NPDC048644 TaxID=3365582 RepID=UPI00371C1565